MTAIASQVALQAGAVGMSSEEYKVIMLLDAYGNVVVITTGIK